MSNYSQASKFKCSPAISFPKSIRTNIGKENLPGPGMYDIKVNLQSAKKTVFSKAESYHLKNKGNQLGPGQYEIKSNKCKNNVVFDKSLRQIQQKGCKNDNIGPGKYNIDNKDIYLKQNKAEPKHKYQSNLGPGQYFNESNQQKLKQIKCFTVMKGSKRFSNHKNNNESLIGPGAYQEKIQTFSKKGGVIGKSKSVNQNKNSINLGPGQYKNFQTPNKINNNAKFGISKRFQNQDSNKCVQPGPGQYYQANIDKQIQKNVQGFIFGKQKREKRNNSVQLGPGQYHKEEKINSKGGKFGKSKKMSLKKSNCDSIGPGAYNTLQQNSVQTGFSFARSQQQKDKNQTQLGPGQYNVQQQNKCRFPFSKAQRSSRQQDQNPGPGQYQNKTQIWSKKGGFMSHLNNNKNQLEKNTIDYYNLPDTIPNVRHYNYPSLDKRKIKPNFNK